MELGRNCAVVATTGRAISGFYGHLREALTASRTRFQAKIDVSERIRNPLLYPLSYGRDERQKIDVLTIP